MSRVFGQGSIEHGLVVSAILDTLNRSPDTTAHSPLQEFPRQAPARFFAALLKVASRCNLACDYCYVYRHEDQSWRDQPHFMSERTLLRFAERLDAYVRLYKLPEFSVTFHGGEPLLYGADRLVRAAQQIRSSVTSSCNIEFSLQTNGTLLTDEAIEEFEQARISVSLSLDGPGHVNDLHRLDHSGKSTFESVVAAIEKLNRRKSDIFRGVIAVIDPQVSPRELFEFFGPMALPRLDLLLPDATHQHPPIGRERQHNLYGSSGKCVPKIWVERLSMYIWE